MKKLANITITLYQVFVSPFLHQLLGVKTACRFEESCSSYARRSIKDYGILYGSQLAVKRILSCQPFRN